MSSYYIIFPGEKKASERSYVEFEVQELFENGTIQKDTLVWCAGMEKWAPLTEALPYLHASEIKKEKEENQPQAPGTPQIYAIPAETHFLRRAFLFNLIGTIIILPTYLIVMWMQSHISLPENAGFSELMQSLNEQLTALPEPLIQTFGILTLLSLVAMFAQPIWIYRASKNLQNVGCTGLRYAPLLSAILVMLPIVGDIFCATITLTLMRCTIHPTQWMNVKLPLITKAYFFMVIAGVVSTFFHFEPKDAETLFYYHSFFFITKTLLWLVNAWLITKLHLLMIRKVKDE